MKTKHALRILLFALVAASVAHAATPDAPAPQVYDPLNRAAYITSTLTALQATSDDELRKMRDVLYLADTTRCRSSVGGLSIHCLVQAAQDHCRHKKSFQRQPCNQVADLVVTNRRSEGTFLPTRVRHKIMENTDDYRTSLFIELRRRYAELVSEMGMSATYYEARNDTAKLATAIDGYCREVAARRPLSWHYCTAAVVWFVGTSDRVLQAHTTKTETETETETAQ